MAIKKAKKKITVMQTKIKFRKFDLSTGKDDGRIMNAFLSLQATEGWALYVQMIQANMAILADQILRKKDVQGASLTDDDVDKLRDRYETYEELINLPDETIQKNMKEDDVSDMDDPFYQRSDLIHMRRPK